MDSIEIARNAANEQREREATEREALRLEREQADEEAKEAKEAADKAKRELGAHQVAAQRRLIELSAASDSLKAGDGSDEERRQFAERQAQLTSDIDKESALQKEVDHRQKLADEAKAHREKLEERSKAFEQVPQAREALQEQAARADQEAKERIESAQKAQAELGKHQVALQEHLESAADLEADRKASFEQGAEVWDKERDRHESKNREWQEQAYRDLDREQDLQRTANLSRDEAVEAVARRDRAADRLENFEKDSKLDVQQRETVQRERENEREKRATTAGPSVGAPGSFASAADLSAVASSNAADRERANRDFLARQDKLHQELMEARNLAVDASRQPALARRDETQAAVVDAQERLALDRERHLAERAQWLSTQSESVGQEAAERFKEEAKQHRAEVARLERAPQERAQAQEAQREAKALQQKESAEKSPGAAKVQAELDKQAREKQEKERAAEQSKAAEKGPASKAPAAEADLNVRLDKNSAFAKAVSARQEQLKSQSPEEADHWQGLGAKAESRQAERAAQAEQARTQTQEQARAKDQELTR